MHGRSDHRAKRDRTVIHPSAIIDPGAEIGSGVSIGPYSIVGADVTIGDGCEIASHVVIQGPTKLGERNRVFQFASVGEEPQDKKFAGEQSWLEVGNDNVIREYVTLNRGTAGGGGVTRVGDRNLLMACSHVAHDCIVGNDAVFANGSALAGHVTVGDYAIIGGNTCVHQFCHIGEHSFLGLNSVANKDLTPFTIAVGNYAMARGINKEGLRRRGFDDSAISALHRAYRQLLKQRGNLQGSIDSLPADISSVAEVRRLVEFMQASERGVILG